MRALGQRMMHVLGPEIAIAYLERAAIAVKLGVWAKFMPISVSELLRMARGLLHLSPIMQVSFNGPPARQALES